MFGRSKLCTTTRGRFSNRRSTTSSRVALSAVAVKASVWTSPRLERARAISRYSGRKSWPHCETQWASSMASRRAPTSLRRGASPWARRRSGETNRSRSSRLRNSRHASSVDEDRQEREIEHHHLGVAHRDGEAGEEEPQGTLAGGVRRERVGGDGRRPEPPGEIEEIAGAGVFDDQENAVEG